MAAMQGALWGRGTRGAPCVADSALPAPDAPPSPICALVLNPLPTLPSGGILWTSLAARGLTRGGVGILQPEFRDEPPVR